MATVQMDKRDGRFLGYEYQATILDGVTGPSIIVPPFGSEFENITCTLIAGASTGKFQFTSSPDSAVAAGTATWQDWPYGNKTGTISDAILSPVTAVRGVSVSGDIVIEVIV